MICVRKTLRAAIRTVVVTLTLAAGWAAQGDEPLPVSDDDRPAPARTKNDKPAADSESDEKLLRALDPADGQSESAIDRMERAIEGMRESCRRMEAKEIGDETLDVQRRVIADLEKLLELLKREEQNQQSSTSQGDPTRSRQSTGRRRMQRKLADPQNSARRQKTESRPQERTGEGKSRESQERNDAARAPAGAEERRQQMIKDVWGHLPPHVRDAIGRTFNEKYLPKYEDLVKRYYEALAEKNRKRSEK